MTERWLSIVGIGEDGRAGLSPAALTLVDAAELVIGGRRHLDLIGPTRGKQQAWSVPLDATIQVIAQMRGRPVCVLASGDPFWFGVGVTLALTIPKAEMIVVPAPSSFSLAAARLGWALQDTVTLGLNMPGLAPTIRRHLHHGQRILALSMNEATPGEVAAVLTQLGFGPSRVWVLEALGGPREIIRATTAEAFNLAAINPLNIMAIEVAARAGARPVPCSGGLADDAFEHDGQITKREVRAITLSSLAPAPHQLLWDVGLGSGSVAIEWLLSHQTTRAVGFEKDGERAARAARNAAAVGVPQLVIRHGSTPDMCVGLEAPDAVFIGGGATEPGMVDACWMALKPGGRMVVNAVTLETEALLFETFDRLGGTLTRISIERAERVGRKHGWRAAMPVMQWVGVKP